MKLLDERTQVRKVAERWFRQYGEGTYGADKRGRMVGRELKALDPETATADEVAEIVGHCGWVCPQQCNECKANSWQVVQLGDEPDYESRTANVCADCLRKALSLTRNAKLSGGPTPNDTGEKP